MAIESIYYIDGATFDVAVSVYLDNNLSLIAPDGWYKFGAISRQQSAGILLTAEACSTCGTPCGVTIGASGGSGVYLINLNAGSDIGAIFITFDPQAVPDGIRITYDGVVYNKLSSPVDGLHQSATYGNYTILGDALADCSLAGNTTVLPSLPEFLYDSGSSSFVSTGNTQSVTILPGDVSLSSISPPGQCVIVIPKPNTTPNNVFIEMIGPCFGTGYDIGIYCPMALPSFASSSKIIPFPPLVEPPCSTPLNQTYYYAKVNNTLTSLQPYDYVFTDANGQYPLADGYYYFNYVSGTTIGLYHIVNGIVVNLNYTSCT